ncbi:MAG: UDP-N-acetylglucosamine--N-acetylmuramyl-(pentapeptide) pyrophosphoryl-undecaprenol N-acetylglucosamine transferase, partial [Tannerellaceae bacterium]|nr:UDP-N-acetylglucosamine--N-acetylmuramyl-(pentapeptide) pyrophosphoryl-undecaprenol N-acetylglucosamine transferase [Tannerellaceae bacterium]
RSIEKGLAVLLQEDIQLIWQTGRYYYSEAQKYMESYKGLPVWYSDFISRMDYAYAAADLVISRAGASFISELCILAKPVLLVPSPTDSEDHQTKNALALVNKEAAVMVTDGEAEGKLVSHAIELVKDDARLSVLSKNIATLAFRGSTEVIVDEIVKIIDKK